MYSIETTDYGFRLTLGGEIDRREADRWLAELKSEIGRRTAPFTVFVDMRYLSPMSDEAIKPIDEGQRFALDNGMTRSVVIVDDNLTALQFIKVSKETGIRDNERYISAIDNEDWEKQGLEWLIEGREPTG